MKPLLLALLLCAAVAAGAQTQPRSAQVYRCGPDGRDLRDSPGPGSRRDAGSTVSYDEPSAADSRAARERHMSEARQAAALAQARRASEAEARRMRSQAIGLQTLPPPPQAASGPQVTYLKPPETAKPRKPTASAGTGQ